MPGTDNRQMTTGIGIMAPAPPKAGKMAGKKTTHVQRVLTPDDNFDEIEAHLTPEEVERLSQPNPVTGVPVLVGDWTGKATTEEYTDPKTGQTKTRIVPAEFEAPDADGKHAKRGRKKAAE